MSFNIIATEPFERKLKKLAKKYKTLKADLTRIFKRLEDDPTIGTPLGKNCYKIRVPISSKGKGKSGGARLITYVRIVKETVFLMDIYDKSRPPWFVSPRTWIERPSLTGRSVSNVDNSVHNRFKSCSFLLGKKFCRWGGSTYLYHTKSFVEREIRF